MTAWSPDWKLTVAGVDYTDIAISDIQHEAGRSDIYQQPNPSYIQVSFVALSGQTLPFDINDSLSLQVKNSAGTYVNLFGGDITDVTVSVQQTGGIATVVEYSVLAMGSLVKLAKELYLGTISQDEDGNQIYDLLSSVLLGTWNDVPAATTWSGYDATETWANAQNVGLGEIDQPGDYELTARSSSEIDVYSLISGLATSGLGYIYEDAQGRICYADATHRSQYLAANGYTEVSASHALSKGIATSRRIGDIRNKVSITHKNGGIATAQDDTSIAIYGQQGQNITTSIENTVDAESQADFYLALRAYPQSLFKSITFELTNPEIDDADRDALIGVFMGLPLYITDLPANLAGGSFEGFVEGWSFNAGFNKLSVTLNLSPVAFSLQYMKWLDVGVAETWNTLNPTLEWIDATIVA